MALLWLSSLVAASHAWVLHSGPETRRALRAGSDISWHAESNEQKLDAQFADAADAANEDIAYIAQLTGKASVLPQILLEDSSRISPKSAGLQLEEGPVTLVYNRLSKTGGTILDRIFNSGAVPGVVIVNEARTLRTGLVDLQKPAFVIGSIRDPCSMMLSHWSMISTEAVKLHCEDPENSPEPDKTKLLCPVDRELCVNTAYCGKDKDNGFAADKERFRSWLNQSEIRQLAAKRLAVKYSGDVRSRLTQPNLQCSDEDTGCGELLSSFTFDREPDCWVETDSLFDHLQQCLTKFSNRGGVVKWDKYEDEIRLIKHQGAINSGVYKKRPNPCQDFFDKETEAFMRKENARYFNLLNYSSCCSSRSKN